MPDRLRLLRLAAATALAAAVAGCGSTQEVKTSEYAGQGKKQSLAVHYVGQLPANFQLEKLDFGRRPVIEPADERCASDSAAAVHRTLESGFRSRFREMASSYGVDAVAPGAAPGQTILIIRVARLAGFRSVYGCIARLHVVATLRTQGKAEWTLSARVGPENVYSKVDDAMFDSFARELLDKMKAAGVI